VRRRFAKADEVVEFEQGVKKRSQGREDGRAEWHVNEFTPDEALFGKDLKISVGVHRGHVVELRVSDRGLTLTFNENRIARNGLKDLLQKNLTGEPLYPIVHLEGEDIEVAFTHGAHYGEDITRL